MTNVATLLRETVEQHPLSNAIVAEESELLYRDLWNRASEFAGGLRKHGVKSGDTVVICLPNGPEFVIALFGTLRNGSVAVPIDPRYDTETQAAIVNAVSAGIVVCSDDTINLLLPEIGTQEATVRVGEGSNFGIGFERFIDTDGLHDFWEVISRDDDDPAIISYTGVKTPRTTGAVVSHETLRTNTQAVADLVPGGLGPDDEQLSVLPAAHLFNIVPVLFATLATGGSYRSLDTPSVGETIDQLDANDITVFHLPPPMYTELAASDALFEADLSSLRVAGCVGGTVPTTAVDAFVDANCDEQYHCYGLTETGPIALVNVDGDPRSLGRAIPGTEARIISGGFETCPTADPDGEIPPEACGELVISGPNVADGYNDDAERETKRFTTVDGVRWFHTGLTTYQDADGYVYPG